MTRRPPQLIVIGASRGGLDALERVLAPLPPTTPPIVIVLHRGTAEDGRLGELIGAHTCLPVLEPDDKTPLLPGHVYVAPADYHLLVERGRIALSTEAPVRHARPSIDVLLESAADAYDSALLAVVLTSASDDGAEGAAEVRRRGGVLIVQDPATAAAPVLPRLTLERAGADEVMSVDRIGVYLAESSS